MDNTAAVTSPSLPYFTLPCLARLTRLARLMCCAVLCCAVLCCAVRCALSAVSALQPHPQPGSQHAIPSHPIPSYLGRDAALPPAAGTATPRTSARYTTWLISPPSPSHFLARLVKRRTQADRHVSTAAAAEPHRLPSAVREKFAVRVLSPVGRC
jgi:hypothetical protein